MSCEGWLTYVDTTLGYCELDTKSIIYLSLLKLNNNDFTLPTLPSRISVKKAQSPIQGFYICTNESVIEAKFETNFESKSFIKLLRNNIDYATEVLHLACKATKILKEDFNIKDKILEQTLILQTLEKLLPIQKSPNAKLLKSVHECKSVKLLTADYNNFPSWSFGVQSEFKNVIFGFLYVCTVKGCLLLRNSHYKFRLILPNSCFKDINALDQSYVLLRNYKTFSEIFSDAKVPNIEYMYVNFGDIVLVSRNQDACFLGQTNIISSNQTFKNVFKFTLKRKSSVSKSNIQKVSFDLTYKRPQKMFLEGPKINMLREN